MGRNEPPLRMRLSPPTPCCSYVLFVALSHRIGDHGCGVHQWFMSGDLTVRMTSLLANLAPEVRKDRRQLRESGCTPQCTCSLPARMMTLRSRDPSSEVDGFGCTKLYSHHHLLVGVSMDVTADCDACLFSNGSSNSTRTLVCRCLANV